jgi:hypothetical protein
METGVEILEVLEFVEKVLWAFYCFRLYMNGSSLEQVSAQQGPFKHLPISMWQVPIWTTWLFEMCVHWLRQLHARGPINSSQSIGSSAALWE